MLLPRQGYSTDVQLMMVIRGWLAWDKEAGVHMIVSHGRRASGRPPRWTVGWDEHFDWGMFHLTAETLEEALTKANKRLARGDLKHERYDEAPAADAATPTEEP